MAKARWGLSSSWLIVSTAVRSERAERGSGERGGPENEKASAKLIIFTFDVMQNYRKERTRQVAQRV